MMRVGITVQKNSRKSHFTELNVDFAHKTKLIRNSVNIRLLCTVTYNDTRACFRCRHVKDFSTNSNTDTVIAVSGWVRLPTLAGTGSVVASSTQERKI